MVEIGGRNTLRVGIYRVDSHYHGKLAGRTVRVGSHTLIIVECPLRELHEMEDANTKRCHFVLNDYGSDGYTAVELERCEMVSNGAGRGWRHYIGGREMFASWEESRKEWAGKTPPAPSEVARTIGVLTRNVSRDKFPRWLETMTPDRWYLAAV